MSENDILEDISEDLKYFIKSVVPNSVYKNNENPDPSAIVVEELNVTENNTYTAPSGKAYSPVNVNVPQTVIEALNVTENGEYTAPSGKAYSPVNVSVSGSGGLDYETGTWTPTADIARGEIAFTNTHDNPPCLIAIYDSSSPSTLGTNSNLTELFFDPFGLNGDGFPYSSTSVNYAIAQYTYTGSSVSTSGQRQTFTGKSSSTSDSSASSVRYWIKPDRFYPFTNSTSRYWRADRTYKWIAVWAPTS